ncbi:MAG: DUF5054 domain-containing protein, partial [Sphaerochaetaceae bacterium]
MINTIHLVFKTHLDIGFTDLAANTIDRYLNQFIPNAIATAKELRERGSGERLVWTTGAWLIKTALNCVSKEQKHALSEAIIRGDITWHALPFTTHTELMDSTLLQYGMSLSKDLDAQFGHTTLAAKMTDVPGHTLSLVPHLARAGVSFLHIGVNGGSPLPLVPPLFVWKAPTGEEILVQYDASYGSSEPIGDLKDLLVIENSADNTGPPRAEEVLAVYRKLRARHPQAKIVASSLDAYARSILPYKDQLPIVREEIGDTWIHGVGSDPYKVSAFKTLSKLGKQWVSEGKLSVGSSAYDRFFDQLLMITEHTWGLDFKKYLADYRNWSVEDFHHAREKDSIGSDAVPPDYKFIEDFARHEFSQVFGKEDNRRECRTYSFFSSSHQEQRSYLKGALDALPHALQEEAATVLETLKPIRFVEREDDKKRIPDVPFSIGETKITIGKDGSIIQLEDASAHNWVQGEGIGVYRYETFGAEDYQRFHQQYNRDFESGKQWILADYGKPGLEQVLPKVRHRLYKGEVNALYERKVGYERHVIVLLDAEQESPRGAPRNLQLCYQFSWEGTLLALSLDWMNKEATRLPEALWLGIGINMKGDGVWKMSKLDSLLALDKIVENGARSIHAVEQLVYTGA